MNDRDLRQLNRMKDVINAFLEGDVSFHNLVSTLSFLESNLEYIADDWKGGFQNKWAELEMIKLDPEIDELKEEIKAVTYHNLKINKEGNNFSTTIVFDI